jgi:hypothetical protein
MVSSEPSLALRWLRGVITLTYENVAGRQRVGVSSCRLAKVTSRAGALLDGDGRLHGAGAFRPAMGRGILGAWEREVSGRWKASGSPT